jgi:hypothetical protein
MRALLLPLAFAVCGCALLGKSDPQVPRYFTPEYDAETAKATPRAELQLRLGRVEGWQHLRERIVQRRSDRELVYRDDLRWTELPEVYLRRALARALFEERGVTESRGGRGPVLEVELIAFEEVAQPPGARFQALFTLRDERKSLLIETVTVDEPLAAAAEPRALAEAFSRALRAGVSRIADKTVQKLAEPVRRAGE